MLLVNASCRLIASMTPRTLDLLVNVECFDVCCRIEGSERGFSILNSKLPYGCSYLMNKVCITFPRCFGFNSTAK